MHSGAREKKSDKAKIYIVDDHQVVRDGLSQYINSTENLVICGMAGDADTALREINIAEPRLVIVDLSLKGASGFELIKAIKERYRDVLILIHSMHEEMAYIERAIRSGANGYVRKNEPVENVITAIEKILRGERYLGDDIKDIFLEALIDNYLSNSADPVNRLTDREFDVFKRISTGRNLNDIAAELRISAKTVQTYRERIKEKLNLKSSKDLLHFAYKWATEHGEKKI